MTLIVYEKNLCIEFEGEEGIDAGALKAEFLGTVMKSLNEELFEGDCFRRLPKCDWGNLQTMEVAGMIVAHSIPQGGPGLSCLSPVAYSYILTGRCDSLEEVPFLKDIPVTAGTIDLINFIQKVSLYVV